MLIRLFILFLIFGFVLNGQEKEDPAKYKIGAVAGPSYIMNQTEIPVLPGNFNCGIYKNGEEISYFGGLNFSAGFFDGLLWADLRLNYEKRPLYLTVETSDFEVYASETDSYVPVVLNNEFNSDLEYIIQIGRAHV